MPPKRKAREDDEADSTYGGTQAGGTQAGGTQAAAIDADTADGLANRLCRFVLLREHSKKPLSRTEMKAAVMSEHNDRSGKIFKQVLAAANEKLKDIAGLELVPEAADGEGGGDDDAGYGTQAVPGAASQSQAGPSTQGAAGMSQAPGASKAAKGGSFLLVNRLPDPYTFPPADAQQIYLAFVEVVLSMIQQSEGVLDEEKMFGYLSQLGLSRDHPLPQQTIIADKVETLVQKRLVSEAYLRRQKKANDADTWQYAAGARATHCRDVAKADAFRDEILSK